MDINIKEIKKLIDLIDKSSVSEIEISQGEEAIRVSRASTMPAQMAYHAPAPVAAPAPPQAPTTEATPVDNTPSGHAVKSPMVGTFYSASAPGEAPYAKIGDKVSVGDTLCIIEAMKMMNHIEADKAGTVKAILLEDATPVEFDQPLIIIE